MEELKVSIEKIDGRELVVRTGDALPAREPNKLSIKGDIKSVSSFVTQRKMKGVQGLQEINPALAVVTVDRFNGTIQLQTDPNNPFSTEVLAALETSDELKPFCINVNKLFSQTELVKLLKFSKLLFKTPEQQEELLKAYTAFNYQANTTGASESDNRGNKATSFKKDLKTNLPEEFTMNVPIYKGQDAKSFHVDICVDVTDAGVRFWFESVQLKDIMEIEKERIFNEELKSCEGLVIIYK